MKLFLVSFTDTAGSEPRMLFFVNAFNKFGGVELASSAIPKLGVSNYDVHYNDWNYPHSSFRLSAIHSLEQLNRLVEENCVRLTNMRECKVSAQVEELSGDMRKWFLTWGTEFVRLCIEALYTNMRYEHRRRVDAVIRSMCRRTYELLRGTSYDTPIATHKGVHHQYPSSYLNASKFCKEMGQLIADSIKDGSDLFSSEFMPDYLNNSTLHNLIADAAHDALSRRGISFEITKFHCDHWGYASEASEVNIGRNRYRTYCECCVNDSDIVIETYDTNILMLRDEAYWNENDEEYYEYEPEDQYEDDDYNSSDREPDTSRLMSYSSNVLDVLSKDDSFTSSPFGEFHMGVELELVTSGFVDSAVSDLRSRLGEDYIICKADGSLPDGGVEVVTAPRKLTDHIKRFSAWEINSQYKAWNTNRCGMHVHIDSRAFTRMTLGKFIVFINAEGNADFIRKIAGRHPLRDTQAQSYCAAEGQDAIENPSKALKGKSSNRYYMVNTTCLRPTEADRLGVRHVGERSFNTIELRIFRASLKKERLLAQLEFTHASIMFCRVASMRDLNGVEFLKWLKSTDNRYPHLSDWYGIRRRAGAKNAAPAENACADNLSA